MLTAQHVTMYISSQVT